MRISVAMATYNGERFIREQLESFSAQSLLPDELVVSDDCSKDRTVVIIGQWAGTAPFPVRIYRNTKRLGYSQNFARALALSHGDYIFMSDQDDIWYKEKIRKMMERMSASDHPLVVICDQMYANQDAIPTGETVRTRIKHLRSGKHTFGCATGVSRYLLPIILPIPEGIAYDGWIHKVGEITGHIAVIEEPLQLWRRHNNAVSTRGLTMSLRRRRAIRWYLYLYLEYAVGNSVETCAKRICVANELIKRFDTSIGKNLFNSEEEWTTWSIRLKDELEFLSRRLHNLMAPFPARCVGAVQLWRTGGYRNASSWRSLLKDCLLGVNGNVHGREEIAVSDITIKGKGMGGH